MSNEEQGTLAALDPDAPAGRGGRPGTSRIAAARGTTQGQANDERQGGMAVPTAEATLSLEPLRVPIATMVQGSLRVERDALERMSTDLRAELVLLHDWRTREEAMRVDQTALYRNAAEHWQAAGGHAVALCEHVDRLEGITKALHAAVEAAIIRFWRRAMLVAWMVALTGLGLLGGLCGVVWLALVHR